MDVLKDKILMTASNGKLFDFQNLMKKILAKKEERQAKRILHGVLEVCDNQGLKAIHLAAREGHTKFVQKLICLGADVNTKCFQGNTPLHYACASSSICCIVILLASGANCTIINVLGKNPFDLIPEKKQGEAGVLLREAAKSQETMSRTNKKKKAKEKEILMHLKTKNNTKEQEAPPYPIELLSHGVSWKPELELAKGPTVCFCKGEMVMMPIAVKYAKARCANVDLIREANTLRYIRHPNVLLCLGICEDKLKNYQLIFEFPSNGFLHRAIFASKLTFKSEEIFHLAKDLANALFYLHKRDFVHCSTATFSIALTERLSAKLCNFDHVQMRQHASPISHLSTLCSYMAPEQLTGEPARTANDIYGLGVILFECATGKKMFNRSSLFAYDKEDPATKLKAFSKYHDHQLCTLIESCLNKVSRRPTAEQVCEWLDASLAGRLISIAPQTMIKEELEPFEVFK